MEILSMQKPLIVIKVGTASITQSNGEIDEPVLVDVARQIASLHKDYRLVLVSSGAVGAGKKYIKDYSGSLTERKAAASIGNPLLINKYQQFFQPYRIHIAQSLCERHHFSERSQFLQLKSTFEELWNNSIIPIVNENDVVSNLEIKFLDNDELATLVAVGFGADMLLIGTTVNGVFDKNGELITQIRDFKKLELANMKDSSSGLGGIKSKLASARLASQLGSKVVIFGLRNTDSIIKAAKEEIGTVCIPRKANIGARQKWMASGSIISGKLLVDNGAYQAILKRNSLLAVGVLEVLSPFSENEVVEISSDNEGVFAIARIKSSSDEIKNHIGKKSIEIVHADDIVIL